MTSYEKYEISNEKSCVAFLAGLCVLLLYLYIILRLYLLKLWFCTWGVTVVPACEDNVLVKNPFVLFRSKSVYGNDLIDTVTNDVNVQDFSY